MITMSVFALFTLGYVWSIRSSIKECGFNPRFLIGAAIAWTILFAFAIGIALNEVAQ